jgi:hypothetical protein
LEWRSGARALLRPLAPTLARLELHSLYGFRERVVSLPPAFSLLTALSALEVSCTRLLSVGPLRSLTSLRRLVLNPFVHEQPERHPPLLPRDLEPLTALEHLHLSEAPPCLAPVLERAFPHLSELVLWEKHDPSWYKPWQSDPFAPAGVILRAALLLHTRQGTEITLLDGKWMHPCMGPDAGRERPKILDAAKLGAFANARGGSCDGHKEWAREVLEEEAELAGAEAEEEALVWGNTEAMRHGVAKAVKALAAKREDDSDY